MSNIFDVLDPKKGFAVIEPPKSLIDSKKAYALYKRLNSGRATKDFTWHYGKCRESLLVTDVINRFKDFVRKEVIDPLSPYEPLKFSGPIDIKTEARGHWKPRTYHTDPWWLLIGLTSENAEGTWILRNGKLWVSGDTFGGTKYPRVINWYKPGRNGYLIKPPRGSLIVFTGNHRENELNIPATPHQVPKYRKGTHRVFLHQGLHRKGPIS